MIALKTVYFPGFDVFQKGEDVPENVEGVDYAGLKKDGFIGESQKQSEKIVQKPKTRGRK